MEKTLALLRLFALFLKSSQVVELLIHFEVLEIPEQILFFALLNSFSYFFNKHKDYDFEA